MRKRTQLIPIVACLVAGLGSPGMAHGYLDPGAGSILLQGLLAGIAGTVVVGKLYWRNVKQFFSRLFATDKNGADSEDPKDVQGVENDRKDG